MSFKAFVKVQSVSKRIILIKIKFSYSLNEFKIVAIKQLKTEYKNHIINFVQIVKNINASSIILSASIILNCVFLMQKQVCVQNPSCLVGNFSKFRHKI